MRSQPLPLAASPPHFKCNCSCRIQSSSQQVCLGRGLGFRPWQAAQFHSPGQFLSWDRTPVSAFRAAPAAWCHQTQFLGDGLLLHLNVLLSATLAKPDMTGLSRALRGGQAPHPAGAGGHAWLPAQPSTWPTTLDVRNATSVGSSRKRQDLFLDVPLLGLWASPLYPLKASSRCSRLCRAIASAPCLLVSCPNSSHVPATATSWCQVSTPCHLGPAFTLGLTST